MNFEIEEVKTKRNRKLVISIIIVILLVLLASVGTGIYAAKIWKANSASSEDKIIAQKVANTKNKAEVVQTNIKSQENIQIVPQSQNEVEQANNNQEQNVKKFLKEVDDIYNGEEGKRVFLTFDDGPSQSVTPHVLDILKENNVKATFFVIGNRISSNSDLLKREYNEGHYIASHGYSHVYSKVYSSSKTVLAEYNKSEKLIQKALDNPNYKCHLFRFPGGSVGGAYNSIKKKSKKVLAKNNIAYLDWNALTNDANGANTKGKIMKSLKQTVKNKNNIVVLMHDAPDKKLTYETLGDVIKYLKEKGYAFKNMYDLM